VIREAATVVLLRPHGGRFSVFLVRRSRAVGFLPTAWVFPGGRVDPSDQDLAAGLPDGGARGAALRETLEEAGIWIGEGDAPLARERRQAGDPAWFSGLVPHPERLVPWSRWITPEAEPRRFDTRFYVAILGEGAAGRHDGSEVVDSGWFDIADARSRATTGELPMAPPTWWTLVELDAHPDLASVAAARRTMDPICPILRVEGGSLTLVLPGHPDHPDPALPGLPAEVGFAQGRWWATAPG
jgi:8-oxo-dGTP pyrophosphatase MutT (NUDIX family)